MMNHEPRRPKSRRAINFLNNRGPDLLKASLVKTTPDGVVHRPLPDPCHQNTEAPTAPSQDFGRIREQTSDSSCGAQGLHHGAQRRPLYGRGGGMP